MSKDLGRWMGAIQAVKDGHKKKKSRSFGSVEEEALERSRIPQDLESFYRTPAGQQFLEDNDFGTLFMKQLEQEKLTKYAPGWQLSKAIFSLFGSMSREQANISEQTRGNMGQALLTGIGK